MGNSRTLVYGQKVYRDLTRNYSFWHPRNWHVGALDELNGVVIYPEDDPLTGFYVTVTDLDDTLTEDVTEEDLPALHEGLLEGLESLPHCEILREQKITKEKALGFEFLLTFVMNGNRDPQRLCKQRLRVLYVGRRQYTIRGQGSPPEEYDIFANIFDFIYMTLKFGDLLLDMGVPLMPDLSTLVGVKNST